METTTTHACGHPVRSNSGLELSGELAAERVKAGCQVCRRAEARAARDAFEADGTAAEERRVRERETEERLSRWVPEARRRAQAALRGAGCVREHTSSSGSNYYRHVASGVRVRVSDHEVPLTEERRSNRAHGGRACADIEIVLCTRPRPGSAVQPLSDSQFEKALADVLEVLSAEGDAR